MNGILLGQPIWILNGILLGQPAWISGEFHSGQPRYNFKYHVDLNIKITKCNRSSYKNKKL